MIDGNEAMARPFTDGPEHPCPELEIEVRHLRAALAEAVGLIAEVLDSYTPEHIDATCSMRNNLGTRLASFRQQHEEARATPPAEDSGHTADTLGRIVRDAWVAWAKRQPDPKPSWLIPWDECDEQTKDADRWIGIHVAAYLGSPAHDKPAEAQAREAFTEAALAEHRHRRSARDENGVYNWRADPFYEGTYKVWNDRLKILRLARLRAGDALLDAERVGEVGDDDEA